MPLYRVPAQNGVTKLTSTRTQVGGHILAFEHDNKKQAIIAGTILVETRAPGSAKFESVPDGSISLKDPTTLLFTFAVAEFRLTITGYSGPAGILYMTDSFEDI